MLPVEKAKLAPPIENREDVGRLLAVIREMGDEWHRPELHPLFALLAYTGLRRGEALGLRWSDVDLDRRMITGAAQLRWPDEEQQAPGRTPVPAALVSTLRAYRLAEPWQGELVFPNAAGAMYSPNAKLEMVLRRALTRAKLTRIRVHDLRHLFASHFVMGGGDIFTLQRILGHSTPQLTERDVRPLVSRAFGRRGGSGRLPRAHRTREGASVRRRGVLIKRRLRKNDDVRPGTQPTSPSRSKL